MTSGAPIVTAAQMRAAEQALFDGGVDPYALMEQAGAAAADIIWRAGGMRDTLVLCGPGNNGGDGYVIARLLRDRGVRVRVAATGESRTESSQRARAAWSGPVEALDGATIAAPQLVDALFGTGLTRGLEPDLAGCLGRLVEAAGHGYAIDLPSGVETDNGQILSPVPHFGVCIAPGALKPAHMLQPAADRIGRLVYADIGIPVRTDIFRLEPPRLKAPGPGDHKYSRGLVGIVGGCMAGAARLAAESAARSGAGMVRLLQQDDALHGPAAIVTEQAQSPDDLIAALSDPRFTAVLVGPGLGRDGAARQRMDIALNSGHPLVVDADALTLLGMEGRTSVPPDTILTPHEGEFERVFGVLPGSKIDRAQAAAAISNAVVIYKGVDTVVAAPDGRTAVAAGAPTWLSTAGTGDVLAGLAAGRLAVTRDSFRAACEALWLHGEAARRAGSAFIADDLPGTLPAAIAARL